MRKLLTMLFFLLCHGFTPPPPKILPMWYPIMPLKQIQQQDIHKITINGIPYVCYKSNDTYIIHTDVCPHQGASLSHGKITTHGNLQCPYHGFEFCNGMFCSIPDPKNKRALFTSKTLLPVFPTRVQSDMLFMSLKPNIDTEPFFPPEEYNSSFRGVSGFRIIEQDASLVIENLLDMLHISYVHSFGSRSTPLPTRIHHHDISNTSGRTVFSYTSNTDTISNRVGGSSQVRVENEFHLPSNTITRVYAGNIIKTVFTRTLPISKGKTLLFWTIYRNFWLDPNSDVFSIPGDMLIKYLMEKTINEDASILKNVYPGQNNTLNTKYDITIREFRKKFQQFN